MVLSTYMRVVPIFGHKISANWWQIYYSRILKPEENLNFFDHVHSTNIIMHSSDSHSIHSITLPTVRTATQSHWCKVANKTRYLPNLHIRTVKAARRFNLLHFFFSTTREHCQMAGYRRYCKITFKKFTR